VYIRVGGVCVVSYGSYRDKEGLHTHKQNVYLHKGRA